MAVTKTLADGLIVLTGPRDYVDIGVSIISRTIVPPQDLLNETVTCSYVDAIPGAPSWAEGLYRGGTRDAYVRKMALKDGTPKVNKVEYTTLHEIFGHATDQDKLDGKRGKVRALMSPRPDAWRDVDGATGMQAYWRYPFECFANRMAEFVVAHAVRSPYDDNYTRYIYNRDGDELLSIVTGDRYSAEDVDPPGDEIPLLDPIEVLRLEMEAQIAQLNATVAERDLQVAQMAGEINSQDAIIERARALGLEIASL